METSSDVRDDVSVWEHVGLFTASFRCVAVKCNRKSPSQKNLGWSNTSAQTETFGANTGGISVQELVGPSRIHVRSRIVHCVGRNSFSMRSMANAHRCERWACPLESHTLRRGRDHAEGDLGDQTRSLKTLLAHKPGRTAGRPSNGNSHRGRTKPTKTIDQVMSMSVLHAESRPRESFRIRCLCPNKEVNVPGESARD